MASTIDKIIDEANSEYERIQTLMVQAEISRANTISLEEEDPCSPGFLDKLNSLSDYTAALNADYGTLAAEIAATKKLYDGLGILDFGDKTAAKAALDRATEALAKVDADARAFGAPARRAAMKQANAQCSVDKSATEDNEQKTSENSQQDDAKSTANNDAPSTTALASGTVAPAAGSSASTGGQKSGTSSGSSSSPAGANWPGARKDNPLSKLSSYAYGLSLYMVTPEAMNTFIATGGSLTALKGQGKGVYVVAQSGGINTAVEDRLLTLDHTLGRGKPGYDYYIDDMTINTLLPGGVSKASTSTEIKFKIVEPMSFTFLQDIARASAELNASSPLLKQLPEGQSPNGFKQHYVIGIKFYGYDVNGSLITASSPEGAGYDNGGEGDQNAIIQRFFAIKFTNVKFKVDGKMVTYSCEAVVVSEQAAFGQINGTVKKQFSITGGTVGEALSGGATGAATKGARGLTQIINDDINDQKDRELISIANKINIEFLDDQGKPTTTSPIARAGLIDNATFSSATAPLSPANTTNKVTIADSFKAVSIDTTKKLISVAAGQNITQVIDNIIVKSNYITDALKETSTQDAENKTVKKPTTSTLKWYNINPVVKILGIDKKTSNWSYEITYQIRPYEIPYIRSTLAGVTSKYPGPFKFYNYLMTGKNTEVISYEQQYDNLFYTVASMSTNKDSSDVSKKGSAPVGVQNNAGKHSDPTTGNQNNGSRLNDEVRAQLYSPGDQSQAKIKILGDPDYIMTSVGVKGTTANKFYGKDSSINPSGGQVFIQVAFNTAADYMADGLLDVSDQLQFYKTANVKKAGIDGIVYMVVQVDSTFSKGTFTQTLDCLMVDEALLITTDSASGGASTTDNNQSAAETKRLSGSAGSTSATTTPASNQSSAIGANGATGAATPVSTEVRTASIPPSGDGDEYSAGSQSAATSASPGTAKPQEPVNNVAIATPDGKTTVDDDAIVWARYADDYNNEDYFG